MTPKELQTIIEDGTFVEVLCKELTVTTRPSATSTLEHPKSEIEYGFPHWFDLLTEETQAMIISKIAASTPQAVEAVSCRGRLDRTYETGNS